MKEFDQLAEWWVIACAILFLHHSSFDCLFKFVPFIPIHSGNESTNGMKLMNEEGGMNWGMNGMVQLIYLHSVNHFDCERLTPAKNWIEWRMKQCAAAEGAKCNLLTEWMEVNEGNELMEWTSPPAAASCIISFHFVNHFVSENNLLPHESSIILIWMNECGVSAFHHSN